MSQVLAVQAPVLHLAKVLLLSLNEGRDELLGAVVVENISPLSAGYLQYEEVIARFEDTLVALLGQATDVTEVTECSGFVTVVESLSAIKYARVTAHRSIEGITTAFSHKLSFPRYSTQSREIQDIENQLRVLLERAVRVSSPDLLTAFKHSSFFTERSSMLHGQKTGATPNLRTAGEPLTTAGQMNTIREI